MVVNADLVNSVKSTYFRAKFPERTIEVGIAEQNMIGIAAGLSTMGFIPVALTFARFASKRAADGTPNVRGLLAQQRQDHRGLRGNFHWASGSRQQTLEDTASMRAMPNMTVIDTADVVEVRAALRFAVEFDGPIYIRIGRDEWPVVFDDAYQFKFGKGQWLREGSDVVLINSGLLLPYAIEAAEILHQEGISAGVINMPTVKPLDTELIAQVARDVGAIVTVENHNILGGTKAVLSRKLSWKVTRRIWNESAFGMNTVHSAPNDDLAEKHELTAPHIAHAARRVLDRKRRWHR